MKNEELDKAIAKRFLETHKKAISGELFSWLKSALIHEEALKLFEQQGLEEKLKFEHAHYDIIKKLNNKI